MRYVLLLAILLTGCRSAPIGYVLPPANYSPSHVIGTWVGLSDTEDTYYRLTLLSGGAGSMVSQTVDGGLDRMRVLSWNLDDYDLQVRFDPSNKTGISNLICFVRIDSLQGMLSGSPGWERDIVFRRATVLRERLDRLFREPENSLLPNPAASPNGGPAGRPGRSGVGGGPPSVR